MKKEYIKQLQISQIKENKELMWDTLWGGEVECDFETLNFETFENWTNCVQEHAIGKIFRVLNLIRGDKMDLIQLLSLPLLEWEKNLKSQKLWDSFVERVGEKPFSFFYHAIAHNAIESIKFFTKEKKCAITLEHLECAINNHAESALSLLLKDFKLSPPERNSLIERACSKGNVTMVNMLFDGPDGDLHYFKKRIETDKEDIYSVVSLAYRNSNMQDVDKALQKYINFLKIRENSQNILKKIFQARQDYLEWGTQIAKYRRESDLNELSTVYLPQEQSISLEQDIKFGLENFNVIKKILEKKEVKLELTEDFKESFPLPSDLKDQGNFYSMRALLSIFSEEHYQEGIRRKNPDAKEFKALRERRTGVKHFTKFLKNRYDHASPFVEAMFTLPDPDNEYFARRPIMDPFGHKHELAYAHLYKGIEMCGVSLEGQLWCHGKAPVKEIWPFIERLHAEVFSMSSEEIRKNPMDFYNKVVEVIWLMGNLSPMMRGTGRYVEQWLALVHKYHGLSMPILKPGLQLDCLDLTFSLPVYQKLFLSFCEPNSLEPFVAAAHQKQCETDPDTIRLMEHFKINRPEPCEPLKIPMIESAPVPVLPVLSDVRNVPTASLLSLSQQELFKMSRTGGLVTETQKSFDL